MSKKRIYAVVALGVLVVLIAGGAFGYAKYLRWMDDERYVVGAMDTRAGFYADAHTGPMAPVGAVLPAADPASMTRKPNIVVIMADDLGWSDVSALGAGRVPTPNIDRLAQWGVAFSNGYVTAPVCAPSRAGLLTGRNQQRFGFDFNIGETKIGTEDEIEDRQPIGLPADQEILPERLKAAGYATGLVGKWHQGFTDAQHPLRRGFDSFYGFIPGTMSYAVKDAPGILTMKSTRIGGEFPEKPVIYDGMKRVEIGPDYYMTDALTEHAISFIDAHKDQPFYLHLAEHAPHVPYQVPAKYAERFKGVESPEMRIYFGMIASLDDSVGKVLDELERLGLRQNTLIFFLSDNGCAVSKGVCGCDPIVNAGKFSVFEGGLRVPFLMSWPARLQPSGIVNGEVSSLDIATTALNAAGISTDGLNLDGMDLMKSLGAQTRPLFWRLGELSAVRLGDWKYVHERSWSNPKLYDLATDPGERHNVAKDHPEVVADLAARFDNWNKGLPKARWGHPLIPWRTCGRWTWSAH